jgi:hypothetical protein
MAETPSFVVVSPPVVSAGSSGVVELEFLATVVPELFLAVVVFVG